MSLYTNSCNDLAIAIELNQLDDYMKVKGSNELVSDIIGLVNVNVEANENRLSREELALMFIHNSGAVAISGNHEETVKNAYAMADKIIEERGKK